MQLFSPSYIRRVDPEGVLASVLALPEQLSHAWKDAHKVKLSPAYRKAKRIVIAGMGGSLLGSHILTSVFGSRLKVPMTFANGYDLPGFVDRSTLVVLSSYSGTTEETLSCAKQARSKTPLRMGIAVGGKLEKMLVSEHKPFYKITPTYNPCGQPRIGVGYNLFGLLALLRSFIGVTQSEALQAIRAAEKMRVWWGSVQGVKTAHAFVRTVRGKQLVVVAPDFLAGNAHVFSNQWNETPKSFGTYFVIPELNHHLLEGLDGPRAQVKKTIFIFLRSPLAHPRNQLRMHLTEQIVKKQGAEVLPHVLRSTTQLSAAVEALLASSILTTTTALTEGINPSRIQWVHYFKEQLQKKKS